MTRQGERAVLNAMRELGDEWSTTLKNAESWVEDNTIIDKEGRLRGACPGETKNFKTYKTLKYVDELLTCLIDLGVIIKANHCDRHDEYHYYHIEKLKKELTNDQP